MNDISEVRSAGLCLQCGTCASVCPYDAIQMEWHDKNGWLPKKNSSICSQCGLCIQACPGISVDFKDLNERFIDGENNDLLIGRFVDCYVGHARNQELRWRASSGGIITALLLAALRTGRIDGAVVVRMDPQVPLRAQAYLARDEKGILAAMGSKYCTAPVGMLLRSVLSLDGRFAVVGLPCHIQGLRKIQKISPKYRDKVPLSISLFCGKNFLPTAIRTVLVKHGISLEDVTLVRYRGYGWPGGLEVNTRQGLDLRIPYPDYLDRSFSSLVLPRCLLCTDGVGELADISCGDAWLPTYRAMDDVGTSVVIARTSAGADLLLDARAQEIYLEQLSVEEVKRSQYNMLLRKKRQSVIQLSLRRLLAKEIPKYKQDLLTPKVSDYARVIKSNVLNWAYRLYLTPSLRRVSESEEEV